MEVVPTLVVWNRLRLFRILARRTNTDGTATDDVEVVPTLGEPQGGIPSRLFIHARRGELIEFISAKSNCNWLGPRVIL